MNDTNDKSVLADNDLRLLIGILSVLEALYLTDDSESPLRHMKKRFAEDRKRFRVSTEISDDREALYRLNVRVRNALGEGLTPEGQPLSPR